MELTPKLSICISCALWNASSSDESLKRSHFYFWEDTLSCTTFFPHSNCWRHLIRNSAWVMCECVLFESVFWVFNSPLSVSLLNSLPIAFDLLIMKQRWKSFFHWSLVALMLFLVSCLFTLFGSKVLTKATCGVDGKENLRSWFSFSFWSPYC